MTIKEIQDKAGSISSYTGYILLVFCWYFLENRSTSLGWDISESSMVTLAQWLLRIFIVPVLLAGVYGGIYEQQRTPEERSIGDFFHGVRKHYWRILGANVLSMVLYFVVMIPASIASGGEQSNLDENKLLLAVILIPFSAINLFWFAATVVERKVFRGLFRSIRTLLFNPVALLVGVAWGVIGFADSIGIDYPRGEIALALDGIRAAVVATARILATIYVFAILRGASGESTVPSENQLPGVEPSTAPGDGLVKAGFGFTFLSFLPFFHLVALILGILALRRHKQFITKSALACAMGGFFTVFYLLLFAGWLVSRSSPSTVPGYGFLSEANADLKPQVTLLDLGSFEEVQQQLEPNNAKGTDQHWTYDSALALAKLHNFDRAGAMEDFRIAEEKNPERSEFYYYYGVALLENDQPELAAQQFRTALLHEPRLEGAQRYLDLIDTTYDPSGIISDLFFVFILLMLFTLHEYGHALAAWKLGDDTAQKQGRLTLNPLPHLEPFGSILLPALLIWQQSQVIFGWAKPVPVNPENFRNPDRDHMRVAFAGPAMNLLIAMLSVIVLGSILLFLRLFWPETLSLNIATPYSSVALAGPPFARSLIILVIFLKQLFYTSLALGCFNLIPIPPLDGSWILSGLLPHGARPFFEKIRRFGFLLFLLLMFTSVIDYFMAIPIGLAWAALQLLVSAMGLG